MQAKQAIFAVKGLETFTNSAYNTGLEINKEEGSVFLMTKIDIFSGFLGAGKTTLIKKLIAEAYSGEKLVLIENEFGEINIDGGFLKESGIDVTFHKKING